MTDFRPIISGFLVTCTTIFLASCGGGGGGGAAAATPVSTASDWLIPRSEVIDGGPGQDGIPSINTPVFQRAADDTFLWFFDRVIGVSIDGEYRAYPHAILNWHEVVNDNIAGNKFSLSYCPLTGSALAWDVDDSAAGPGFGVTGLLYNSNLIMFDHETESRWSQMLELAVWGNRSAETPTQIQVIETTWGTWLSMYPNSSVLTRDTGHERTYRLYPYGNYFKDDELLFPVSNLDNRLHKKERVVGIHSTSTSKVYQISGFGPTTQAINDQFDGQPIVVAGNSDIDFGVIFSRELTDGTLLTFSPLNGRLPAVMEDNEGNVWNLFGTAISGPRTGTQLASTNSYIAMWFAWATFFDNAEIHFN